MKKRVLYGTAIVLLAVSVVLVVWLGSFNLGDYGPSNPQQTFLFCAVSILYSGSHIKTKLVVGRA